MDHARSYFPDDAQLQQDTGAGRGHRSLYHPPMHSSNANANANGINAATPQPSSHLHPQQQHQQRAHRQQRWQPSSSGAPHNRSPSLDRDRAPPTLSMDPTGMFRNRGRRVIAGSRSNTGNAGVVGGNNASPTSTQSPSPPQNKNQHHGNGYHHDNNNNMETMSNGNESFFIGIGQHQPQDYSSQQQQQQSIHHHHHHHQPDFFFRETSQSEPMTHHEHHRQHQSQSQSQQRHSFQSSKLRSESNTRDEEDINLLEFNEHEVDDNDDSKNQNNNHVETRILLRQEQEEPEQDHPPQPQPNSWLLDPEPESGGRVLENPNADTNLQEIKSDNDNDNDNDIYNLIYNESNNDEDDDNNNNKQPSHSIMHHQSENPTIVTNSSHDSNDSEQDDHSTVGSTVSIMGSVTGEGDYSSTNYNEARLFSVRRRMMQDVEEVSEELLGDDDERAEDLEDEDSPKNLTLQDNEEASNFDTSFSSNKNNNDSFSFEYNSGKSDVLNISLECNADTDTSLLENHPIDDTIPEDESIDNEEVHQYTPQKVANFTNHIDDTIPEDESIDNEEVYQNTPKKVANFTNHIDDTIPEDESIDNEEVYQNTPKKVANFTNTNSIRTNNKNAINENNGISNGSPQKKQQESPFRAAFRRSLSPLHSHMLASGPSESLKRLTPNRFHKVSATSAIDRAATTASRLPQLARQCFSFEDTTLDDDDFLAMMPDQLRIAGGEMGNSTSHKYYGLSAVASFSAGDKHAQSKGIIHMPDIEASTPSRASLKKNAPKWHPPHPTRLSYGKQESPFRVIRHSRTWDPQGESPLRQPIDLCRSNGGYLQELPKQTSSFDPWSRPMVGRSGKGQVQPLGNIDSGHVEQFQIDCRERQSDEEEKQESELKDWKKIEVERRKAAGLLSTMVKLLDFDEKRDDFSCAQCCKESSSRPSSLENTDNHCRECLENMKLIASAVKEISADFSDSEQSSVFNHQIRSNAIDTLLRSYEFALKVKQSSSSANKWRQSVESANNSISRCESKDQEQSTNQSLSARLRAAENTISDKQAEISRLKEEIGRLKSSSTRAQPQHQPVSMLANQSILSDSSSDSSIESSTPKNGPLVLCSPRPGAKLSESDDKSFAKWEKNIDISMNMESRKEILLLKAKILAANRKISTLERQKEMGDQEPFSSEIEPIKALSDDGQSEQLFMRIAEDIENEADITVFSEVEGDDDGEDTCAIPAITLSDPALEKELEEYRTALITSLRAEEKGKSARADSITSSEDANLVQDLSKSNSSEPAYSDQKMVNVRMIDGENFTTEWGDLAPALPPPPDHELHSPIVDAILSNWTDDLNTRSALIKWIENILNGSNAEPSLKLSGLDHQIRDGFVMHVLPLLLRRKDVHVHLTTRAHRQTTYDIAVSVRQSVVSTYDRVSDAGSEDPDIRQQQFSHETKHHLMAFQATHSGASIKENANAGMSPNKQVPSLTNPFLGRTIPALVRSSSNAGSICASAVTSPISNRTPSRRPLLQGRNRYTQLSSEMKKGNSALTQDFTSPSLGDFLDDVSVGSSVEDDNDSKNSHQQSSLMGSISGAFGLLSRRKPSPAESQFNGTKHSGNDGMFQTPKRNANQNSFDSFKEEEHPYHRVVSAPPGKIGITFVEYRGHAMVSHVSDESPLVSYIFPSDVLIAIDDVPVSGLRTRDIVKLLTNKARQQRNLRMVSAVAMNE